MGTRVPSQQNSVETELYINARLAGLDPKDSVRAATTGSITLSGEQTIDGVDLITGDRVLVKDFSGEASTANGIYVVDSGAWARSTDADADAEVTSGLFTFVEEGTVNESTGWVLNTPNPIELDTTWLQFVQFSDAGAITAGDGLSQSGNAFNVGGTTSRISVSADNVDIDASYAGQTSINTVGTVGTGTWQGDVVGVPYGGTGNTYQGISVNPSLITASTVLTKDSPSLMTCNMTLNSQVITLPDSTTCPGKSFTIVNPQGSSWGFNVTRAGSDTINQFDTSVVINANATQYRTFTSDGNGKWLAPWGTHGASTVTSGRVPYFVQGQLGTSPVGTAGQPLLSGGTGNPTWGAPSVANGGTGSTTASGARTNLGAAASGANSDITSLSGLTTPLSIGQGGSGQDYSNIGSVSSVITSATTLTKDSPSVVIVDSTAGTFALTLPDNATCAGKHFTVINNGTANSVTLLRAGSDWLEEAGSASRGVFKGSSRTIVSTGTGLWITVNQPRGIDTSTTGAVACVTGAQTLGLVPPGLTGEVLVGNGAAPPAFGVAGINGGGTGNTTAGHDWDAPLTITATGTTTLTNNSPRIIRIDVAGAADPVTINLPVITSTPKEFIFLIRSNTTNAVNLVPDPLDTIAKGPAGVTQVIKGFGSSNPFRYSLISDGSVGTGRWLQSISTNTQPNIGDGAILYFRGGLAAANNVGSTGQPLLSGGTGQPTFGTLSTGGGGTGSTLAGNDWSARETTAISKVLTNDSPRVQESTAAVTYTLPAITAGVIKEYLFVMSGLGTRTFATTGGDTVMGGASPLTIASGGNYKVLSLISDGVSSWLNPHVCFSPAGGTYTQGTAVKGAVPYFSDMAQIRNNTPGTTGQALRCGGTGAPTFGVLAEIGGGTGTTLFTSGQATFATAGSVAVADATITASSIIVVTETGTGAVDRYSVTVDAGVGFTIYSSNASSTAVVNYVRLK